MTEHYCPYCRSELMADNHAADCAMGQTMIGQASVFGLRLRPIGAAIYSQSRRSRFGRVVWWVAERIYGPLTR